MNIALWIVAGLLAAGFLASGVMKLARTREKLISSGMTYFEDFNDGTVKAIGVLEILAGVGLILPAVLDIAPILVPLAALGLVLLMVGANITHLRRREVPGTVVTLVFLALAAFVAWGRLGPEPFTS